MEPIIPLLLSLVAIVLVYVLVKEKSVSSRYRAKCEALTEQTVELKAQYEAAAAQEKERHTDELRRIEEANLRQVAELKEQAAAALARTEETCKTQLAERKEQTAAALSRSEEAGKKQVAELKEQGAAELNRSENTYKKHLAELREQSAAELSRSEETYKKHVEGLKEQAEAERKRYEELLTAADQRLQKEMQHQQSLREENDRRWAERLDTLKKEMQKTAAEELNAKQRDLQETNRAQMDELLKPIKEQFTLFKRSVDESRTQGEVSKKEIQKTFEGAMQLFQQEQRQTVAQLREETGRIGNDAANLTKALKGESKLQGNWGEMVLETLLENSGLEKDEQFTVQDQYKDADGNVFYTDVIVHFPDNRSVIIDSKVSLTAYAEAVAAEDEHDRERLLNDHALSVRRHVDELADKDYTKVVGDAIGFVLMFIPNESSYIAAMKKKPELMRYAYERHIIIISPSNLLMALQLAYNLWQYDRQNKNVEKIVKAATDLYNKMAVFSETYDNIRTTLDKLTEQIDKGRKQLFDGKGNLMRKIENLKQLGITPEKQIKGLE